MAPLASTKSPTRLSVKCSGNPQKIRTDVCTVVHCYVLYAEDMNTHTSCEEPLSTDSVLVPLSCSSTVETPGEDLFISGREPSSSVISIVSFPTLLCLLLRLIGESSGITLTCRIELRGILSTNARFERSASGLKKSSNDTETVRDTITTGGVRISIGVSPLTSCNKQEMKRQCKEDYVLTKVPLVGL